MFTCNWCILAVPRNCIKALHCLVVEQTVYICDYNRNNLETGIGDQKWKMFFKCSVYDIGSVKSFRILERFPLFVFQKGCAVPSMCWGRT